MPLADIARFAAFRVARLFTATHDHEHDRVHPPIQMASLNFTTTPTTFAFRVSASEKAVLYLPKYEGGGWTQKEFLTKGSVHAKSGFAKSIKPALEKAVWQALCAVETLDDEARTKIMRTLLDGDFIQFRVGGAKIFTADYHGENTITPPRRTTIGDLRTQPSVNIVGMKGVVQHYNATSRYVEGVSLQVDELVCSYDKPLATGFMVYDATVEPPVYAPSGLAPLPPVSPGACRRS